VLDIETVGATGVATTSVELPQPHAHRLNAIIALATITRMSFLLLSLRCRLL